MLSDPQRRKQPQWAIGGSQEKRARRDEQAETHAPEMAYHALGSGHTAAEEHTKIACAGKKHDRAHKEIHSGGNAILWRNRAAQLLHSAEPGEGTERQGNQQKRPIVRAGLKVSAASGEPGRENKIEG